MSQSRCETKKRIESYLIDTQYNPNKSPSDNKIIRYNPLHIWDKVPTFASWFFHNSIRLKVKVRAELSGDSFLLKDHESLRTLRTAEGSFLFSQTTCSLT